jgi:hypothetical protein
VFCSLFVGMDRLNLTRSATSIRFHPFLFILKPESSGDAEKNLCRLQRKWLLQVITSSMCRCNQIVKQIDLLESVSMKDELPDAGGPSMDVKHVIVKAQRRQTRSTWRKKHGVASMRQMIWRARKTPYPGKTKEQISFYFLDKKRSNKNWKSKRLRKTH